MKKEAIAKLAVENIDNKFLQRSIINCFVIKGGTFDDTRVAISALLSGALEEPLSSKDVAEFVATCTPFDYPINVTAVIRESLVLNQLIMGMVLEVPNPTFNLVGEETLSFPTFGRTKFKDKNQFFQGCIEGALIGVDRMWQYPTEDAPSAFTTESMAKARGYQKALLAFLDTVLYRGAAFTGANEHNGGRFSNLIGSWFNDTGKRELIVKIFDLVAKSRSKSRADFANQFEAHFVERGWARVDRLDRAEILRDHWTRSAAKFCTQPKV